MTLREWSRYLENNGVAEPQIEAEYLLRAFVGAKKNDLFLSPDKEYDGDALRSAAARRIAGEPLAYILGEWTFYRQTYEVSPDCLIPRSDTEILVEYAVKNLPRGARFADLCTGSGCIAVSVLAERPDTRCTAVELNPETRKLAERNAARNGVSARFDSVGGDVLCGEGLTGEYDAILSNPPYIPSATVDTLSREVGHEPRMALDGGEDGLTFYRAIPRLYGSCLKPGGMFLFEIGYDQEAAILSLAEQYGYDARVYRDLGGNPRLAVWQKSEKGIL